MYMGDKKYTQTTKEIIDEDLHLPVGQADSHFQVLLECFVVGKALLASGPLGKEQHSPAPGLCREPHDPGRLGERQHFPALGPCWEQFALLSPPLVRNQHHTLPCDQVY